MTQDERDVLEGLAEEFCLAEWGENGTARYLFSLDGLVNLVEEMQETKEGNGDEME